jgi:alkylation response protein AidB-like acyl-CoA dehydrogenase
LGCCEQALALTAKYTSEREQFGRPLSTNQGVAIRAADAYIDIDCMRVTMWQAAWRISVGLPARDEIDIAKYWAAEGGQRVVHATQHLHGGMGADIDYPVHRYFLWVKQLENTFGSAPQHLARLGRSIAGSATSDRSA